MITSVRDFAADFCAILTIFRAKLNSFRLNTLFIGRIFLHLPETGSTNDFALEWAKLGPAEGAMVLADYQSNGKGQRTNVWFSDAGKNLTFSILLYPRFLEPGSVFLLNKLVSVAIVQVLKKYLPSAEVKIKWPNDILVNRKKICGILIENILDGAKVVQAVVGIGLNVNQEEFPPGLIFPATSMKNISGSEHDLMEILEGLSKEIEVLYLQLKSGNTSRLDFEYTGNLISYQEKVNVVIGDETESQEAIFTGVDSHGRVALEINRKLHYFQPKEIRFLF